MTATQWWWKIAVPPQTACTWQRTFSLVMSKHRTNKKKNLRENPTTSCQLNKFGSLSSCCRTRMRRWELRQIKCISFSFGVRVRAGLQFCQWEKFITSLTSFVHCFTSRCCGAILSTNIPHSAQTFHINSKFLSKFFVTNSFASLINVRCTRHTHIHPLICRKRDAPLSWLSCCQRQCCCRHRLLCNNVSNSRPSATDVIVANDIFGGWPFAAIVHWPNRKRNRPLNQCRWQYFTRRKLLLSGCRPQSPNGVRPSQSWLNCAPFTEFQLKLCSDAEFGKFIHRQKYGGDF